MKRSMAPSQRDKFLSPVLPRNSLPSTTLGIHKSQQISNSDSLSRINGSTFISLKEKTQNSFSSEQVTKNEVHLKCLEQNSTSSKGIDNREVKPKKIFNVVFGKPTKKKHKTWEGDGILEIGIKLVTLKDSDGKILGTSTNVKIPELDEGSRIFVGSKEVELIDLISQEITHISNKRDREEVEQENCNMLDKKIMKKSRMLQPITPTSTLSNTKKLFSLNNECLVMPRPDDEHQWVYNLNYESVNDVLVDPNLNKHLRPHQRDGVIFIYKCVTGIRSLKYTGVILADEMGLGKTLQTITVIWTLLRSGPYGGKPFLKKAMIVVPSSLVQNWRNEFLRWIGSHRIRLFVVDKKNKPKDYLNSNCPIMILSYEQFVRNVEDVKDVEFDLIVCDEGHRLKNSGIQAASHLINIPCKQRLLLTGTPIQNDLQEFYTLVDFVNPGILGSPSEFRRNFANAIIASRDPKAIEQIVYEGKEKAEELNRFTSGFILRRTQAVIGSYLPQKKEYVIFCAASALQKKLYSMVSNMWLERMEEKSSGYNDINHLSTITVLKKICNHPVLLQNNKIDENINVFNALFDEELNDYILQETDSSKLCLVMSLLRKLNGSKERIVLVSNFTQTLDLFASICDKYQYKYMKFDGTTTSNKRSEIVNAFNSEEFDIYILLLSSKAGGVGLNLIGGTRLILYDSDWNPAVDIQAMARIWRDGQKKNVYIYRLLTTGTIEEKIFQRQLTKTGLSESIVDPNCKSSVKLSKEEIMDLFDFTGDSLCLTHKILKCNCCCDGSIPNMELDNFDSEEEAIVEERECQITLTTNDYKVDTLRMNQLYLWQHHGEPIQSSLLEEMKMETNSCQINFIFKNTTN